MQWLRLELQHGELSRAALGRGLCERDGWRNLRGALCAASARKALPQLAAQLGLALPPAQPGPPRGGCGRGAGEVRLGLTEFGGSLEELGEVRLGVAETAAARKLCAGLLEAGHPLGRATGAGLPPDVSAGGGGGSAGGAELRVGAVAAGAARRAFGLGRPHARVAHPAGGLQRPVSAAAGGAGAELGLARAGPGGGASGGGLGSAPRGAAGAGGDVRGGVAARDELSGGGLGVRGPDRGAAAGRGGRGEPKRVWLRGLEADWEQTLRRTPARAPGSFPALALDDEASWARREFVRSDLADGRLRQRLERLGASWERHPGQPLPAIFPGSAEQQAAYRFLHNSRVCSEDILQPHREALVERCRLESTVLLVQDTTTLNYSGLKDSTKGLGPLQERNGSARGLFVHAAVAFTPGRRPLGVSGLETWARPEAEPEAEREKESRRWFRGFIRAGNWDGPARTRGWSWSGTARATFMPC